MSIRDVGLVRDRRSKALQYGWHHGFGRRWLPYSLKRFIVRAWNPVACACWGHNWHPDFHTATWSMQPCICEPELRAREGHEPEHNMPTGWTHDECSNCRARRITHDH